MPLFATSLEAHQPRIAERLAAVAASGRYILGPEVESFESELAAYLGVRHVVGVANGTEAITIALRALGVGAGDEVVVPSFTFYATVEGVVNAGAVPVFCDIDPQTFCVTAETVSRALTPRTRAIVPVHLFGGCAPVDDLRALGKLVVADSAQALGAELMGSRESTVGDVATFSFYPSKNLGGLGDGGALATDDDEVAARARRLRLHGSRDKVTYTEVGYNSRLDELQAAVLRLLLPELDAWNDARRAVADAYRVGGLGDHVQLPVERREVRHVYHLYVVCHERPDELIAHLHQAGIGAGAYYRRPVHRQPAMAPWAPDGLTLPGTDRAARTHLALPMGPELTADQVSEVISACASGSI